MDTDSYITIEKLSMAEFTDKGSKFICYTKPIINSEEFKVFLLETKKMHPKAVHHCFAYRLGMDKNNFRANDDGEPSGSAGKPILGQIDSMGLTNVAAIVVRYFGGTLLGVPGLINAYKTSTKLALENAIKLKKLVEYNYLIKSSYEEVNAVMQIAKRHSLNIISKKFDINCEVVVSIPNQALDSVLNEFGRSIIIEKQLS